jgi:hypothetical protein
LEVGVGLFCIGGYPFEVAGPAPLIARLEAHWRPFLAPDRSPRAWISVEPSGPPVTEPVVQLPVPALVMAGDGGWTLSAEGFEATGTAQGKVQVRGPNGLFPVDVVARVLLAQDLAERGGVLVHAVALAHRGRAALFSGDSGAGKSTLGHCASQGGLARLADELVAVAPDADGGGYLAVGTPWNVGHPVSAKLSWMGLLAHAPGDWLEPVAASEVLRVLLSNLLVADPSPEGRARVLRNATALLRTVKTTRLHFRPTPEVAGVLRDALAGPD